MMSAASSFRATSLKHTDAAAEDERDGTSFPRAELVQRTVETVGEPDTARWRVSIGIHCEREVHSLVFMVVMTMGLVVHRSSLLPEQCMMLHSDGLAVDVVDFVHLLTRSEGGEANTGVVSVERRQA